jgi:hypothetical protein
VIRVRWCADPLIICLADRMPAAPPLQPSVAFGTPPTGARRVPATGSTATTIRTGRAPPRPDASSTIPPIARDEPTPFSVAETADIFAARKRERLQKDAARAKRNDTSFLASIGVPTAASPSRTRVTTSAGGSSAGALPPSDRRRLSASAGLNATSKMPPLPSASASSSSAAAGAARPLTQDPSAASIASSLFALLAVS